MVTFHTPIYDTDATWVRSLVDLSPLSIAKLAQAFQCNRVNLFGVLAGRTTLGENRYMDFLEWMGMDKNKLPNKDSQEIKLTLLDGMYVWEVTSTNSIRALKSALQLFGLEKLDVGLVMTADIPDRDVVRVLLRCNKISILLSLSASMVDLVRKDIKDLCSPKTFWYIPQRYSEVLTKLGAPCAETTEQPSYTGMRLDPNLLTRPEKDEEIKFNVLPNHFPEWMSWLRRKMHIDTSDLLLPHFIGTREKDNNYYGNGRQKTESDEKRTEKLAWLVYQQLLDVGEGSHPLVCDVPVYHVGEVHNFPQGMVRLHHCVLGENLLTLAKSDRLRLYLDPDNISCIYLVGLKVPQKVAPDDLKWGIFSNDPDLQSIDLLIRYNSGESQTWRIGRLSQPVNNSEIIEGVVVATWNQNVSAINIVSQ